MKITREEYEELITDKAKLDIIRAAYLQFKYPTDVYGLLSLLFGAKEGDGDEQDL